MSTGFSIGSTKSPRNDSSRTGSDDSRFLSNHARRIVWSAWDRMPQFPPLENVFQAGFLAATNPQTESTNPSTETMVV